MPLSKRSVLGPCGKVASRAQIRSLTPNCYFKTSIPLVLAYKPLPQSLDTWEIPGNTHGSHAPPDEKDPEMHSPGLMRVTSFGNSNLRTY